jgi:uncharacterized protein with PQ loop repeat
VSVFEILGATGIVISALAYLPQVIHLAREHCSAGISSRAWTMWLVSSVLVGALAVQRRDPVFIMLQLSTLTSATIIAFLAHKYRGLVCEAHARLGRPSRGTLEPVAEEEMIPVRTNPEQATPGAV